MSQGKPRGRFVWFDLMTTNPEATHAFYPAVTGWGMSQWKGPLTYTMWTTDGVPLGGVMEMSNGARTPYWLSYISTPDVDATVKLADDLGARVLTPPSQIPTVGRFAVLTDPQGAAFAIFTPDGEAPGHEGEAEIGEFSWHELATHDYPAAYRFYERLFQWEKMAALEMGGGAVYQMFGRAGVTLGGMFNNPPEAPVQPGWLHYVRVSDLPRAIEAVTAHGGHIVSGPMEVPGGDTIAQCVDPQGARFALHAKKSL